MLVANGSARVMHHRSAGRRSGSTQLESPALDPLMYLDRLPGGSVQQPGVGTLCRLYTAEIAAVSNSSSEPPKPPLLGPASTVKHALRSTSEQPTQPMLPPAHAAPRGWHPSDVEAHWVAMSIAGSPAH